MTSSRARKTAFMLPGFGGSANQPLLVKLEHELTAIGHRSVRLEIPRGRPSPGLNDEMNVVGRAARRTRRRVMIGRSFGSRVMLRWSLTHECDALVLLAFPFHPPSKPRPDDVAALQAVRCPTLIVQGTDDELGPIDELRALSAPLASVTLVELPGAGHAWGGKEKAGRAAVVEWLDALAQGRET